MKKIKKFKIKESLQFVTNYSNNENIKNIDRTWIDDIWKTIAIPERSIEVEQWISKNPDKALLIKGKHGENMIHWAVLSNISLTMAINNCGVNINAKDKDGKTPFDWLMERYNIVFVSKEKKVNKEGENRIKHSTQSVGSYIWSIGARPSCTIEELKEGKDIKLIANIADGELWIVKLLYFSYGKSILRGWLKDGRSMIHLWSLSPKSPIKKQGFETLMSDLKLSENFNKNEKDEKILSIDEVDLNGRTALWYSVDAIFQNNLNNNIADMLLDNIEILLSFNANTKAKDRYNISPEDIINKNKENNMFEYISILFDKYNINKGE